MVTAAIAYFKTRSDIRKLISNFFALYLNNAANYIVPLIIVPYLLRVVGIAGYGYFVFAFAFASYFKIIVDFGFDITITRQIVQFRYDKELLSEIFSLVLFARFMLFLLCALVFTVLLYFIPLAGHTGRTFFILNFLYVTSAVINLSAFFYAFEEIRYTTVATAAGKILYLLGLFWLVKGKADLQYVALFSTLSWIVPALVLLLYGVHRYKLRLVYPGFKQHILILQEAKNAFISDMAVSLYSVTNVFILGLTTPAFIVGVYGGVEKIFSALTMLLSSSNYVLYPRLIKYYQKSAALFKKRLQQTELLYFTMAVVTCVLMYCCRNYIIAYLFGRPVTYAAFYLLIFSLAIIFSPFGSLYTRCLLILNRSALLIRITTIGFVVNLAVLLSVVKIFKNDLFIPLNILITQIYICITKRRFVNSLAKK